MSGPCWICLIEDDDVVRNPPPCTCVSGGWIHPDCLRNYALASGTRRLLRISMELHARRAIVCVLHAPCRAQMPAMEMALLGHTDFVAYIVGMLLAHMIMVRRSLVLAAVGMLGCYALLILTYGSWLQLMLAIALVGGAINAPIVSCELRHRWLIYALGAVVFVLDSTVVILSIVVAAVSIRTLFYANLRPWVVSQLPRA